MLQSEPMQRCRLEECRAACCLHGVWIDTAEWQDILDHADLIIPHMPSGWDEPTWWIDDRREDDPFSRSGQVVHSRVLPDPMHYGGTACVFLREDFKCALQVAGDTSGLHPWRFKPFYCVLHPLDLDQAGRITLDETELLLDEPGSCLRPADKPIPLTETFAPELRHIIGETVIKNLRNKNKPQSTQRAQSKKNENKAK